MVTHFQYKRSKPSKSSRWKRWKMHSVGGSVFPRCHLGWEKMKTRTMATWQMECKQKMSKYCNKGDNIKAGLTLTYYRDVQLPFPRGFCTPGPVCEGKVQSLVFPLKPRQKLQNLRHPLNSIQNWDELVLYSLTELDQNRYTLEKWENHTIEGDGINSTFELWKKDFNIIPFRPMLWPETCNSRRLLLFASAAQNFSHSITSVT